MTSSPARALDELISARQDISDTLGNRRVAIAQEWIGARAGSEKVFEALAQLVPAAELFALTQDPACELDTGGRPIATTFLDRARLRRHRALTLPLMPLAWRFATHGHYDVVVTSAHAFARNFGRHGDLHLSYVHSPARYLWFPDLDVRAEHPVTRLAQAPARAVLKRVDAASTKGTDSLAANSVTTQERIREVYERDARVIHPPVDTVFYHPSPVPRSERLLAFGRLISYKRFDAAIEVAARLDRPLAIAGTGPDEERLRRLAATTGADVTFTGRVSDEEIRELYRTSAALLFLGVEDFGIIPVEAQACGLPVVGAGAGGTVETVVDGATGAHAAGTSLADFAEATERVLRRAGDPDACRSNALQFGYAAFGRRIADWLAAEVGGAAPATPSRTNLKKGSGLQS